MSGYIYLASPYSSPDRFCVETRYQLTANAVVEMRQQGLNVFSPIIYCHALAHTYDLPTDAESWAGFNEAMLFSARFFWILPLAGWRESKGITQERRWAVEWNKPAFEALKVDGQWERSEQPIMPPVEFKVPARCST